MSLEEKKKLLSNSILDGEEDLSRGFTDECLELGADPTSLIEESIKIALDEMGERFPSGAAFLPELILAGDAAKAALEIIIPKIQEDDSEAVNKGTVVIGAPFGDVHDIGKNIVGAILTARGFKVVDLGTNVPPSEYIDDAKKENANIIAISTLLTTSLPFQREVIQILHDIGNRDQYFVIVGGGPVTSGWTKEINADGYGWSGNDAANLCLQLMDDKQKPPLSEPVVFGAVG